MKKIILTLFLIISMFPITILAQDSDYEIITEIGTIEEVSPIFNGEINLLGNLNYAGTVGRVWVNNELRYLTKLTLDGNPVYCIQPGILAQKGDGYNPCYDYLDDATKDALWRICFYGYGNFGRNSDEYFVATQLLLWEQLGIYGDPYYDDEMQNPYNVQNEKWDILNAINNQNQKPSFDGYTFEVNLNETFTINDTNGVLNSFPLHGGHNVNITNNGNDLNITVTGLEYDRHFTFSNNSNGLQGNIVYTKPGSQTIFMASRSKPGTSFGFNVKLNTGNITINKYDEYDNIAKGYHEFGIYSDKECQNLIKKINTNGNHTVSLNDYLVPGTYYLKELSTSFPYLVNNQIYTFIIKRNETTTININNELASFPLTITKNDLEDTNTFLNDTWYTVYDITDIQKPNKQPVHVFSKILLSDLCEKPYQIANPSLVEEKDGYLVGLANGSTTIFSNNKTIYIQINMDIKEPYIDYQIIEDDLNFPTLNDPIPLFKGKTGHKYLRLTDSSNHNLPLFDHTIKIYLDKEYTNFVKEIKTDDYGVICLSDLNLIEDTTYYYTDEDQINDSFTYKQEKEGHLFIDDIKYGRTLEVCEVKAKEGYELNDEACQIYTMNNSKDYNETNDIIQKENKKRRIDLTIQKKDSDNKQLLDMAGFDIYQIIDDELIKLNTFYTGLFQVFSTPNTNIVYWQDENNKQYAKTDENGTLLLPLEEGTYYYQALDDNLEAITTLKETKVIKGSIYFEDLIYGDKLKVCEIKTPSGYIENNSCHYIDIKQDVGIDHMEYDIFNNRITINKVNKDEPLIPNMGI